MIVPALNGESDLSAWDTDQEKFDLTARELDPETWEMA